MTVNIKATISGFKTQDSKTYFNISSSLCYSTSWLVNNKPVVQFKRQGSTIWYVVDGDIESVSRSVRIPAGIIGYSLRKPLTPSENLPEYISVEDIETEYDYDAETTVWSGKYENLSGFYDGVIGESSEKIEEVDFEITSMKEYQIDKVDNPVEMKVTLKQNGCYGSGKTQKVDISLLATYSEIEKLLVPDLLIHYRPCELTSQTVYRIVRNYIQENHDPKYCQITSNYDFCFVVAKKIVNEGKLIKKELLKTNGKPYNSPKYATTHEVQMLQVFEMTYAGYEGKKDGYKGYTPIKPIKGNNLQDLADNLKQYLDEIIAVINAPIIPCECCGGSGTILKKV